MKYIRTKDGIYNYEPTHDIDVDGFIVQHNLTGWDKPIMKEDIIKITDTIEELCDYEMHYDNNGEFVIRPIKHVDFESLKRVIISKWFKDCKLAIKTDKGLIYVAKMNDKGELELL